MPASDPLAVVRYLDVVVVVLAAPFVILTGAPVLGYAVGAAAWLVTRVAGVVIERAARRRRDARAVAALNLTVLLGRVWVVGLSILAVGLAADREDGLMAALLALVAFTVYLATSLIIRPLERKPGP
jgi:TctA family transporter